MPCLHNLCHESNICNGAPLDGQRWQPMLLPAQSQRVHRSIGKSIVGLPCTHSQSSGAPSHSSTGASPCLQVQLTVPSPVYTARC